MTLSLSSLDTQLDGLNLEHQDEKSFRDKLTVILRGPAFEEYVNGVDKHFNALNLLLNALQWLVRPRLYLTRVDTK